MKTLWRHYELSAERTALLLDIIVPLPRCKTRNRASPFDWMQPLVCQLLEEKHKQERPPTVREIQRYLATHFGERGNIPLSTLHRRLTVWQLNLFLMKRK